jgi:TolB protein
MNADGTGQTRLTNNPSWDDSPSWSPDGNKIAFDSARDGNGEIYIMNADGTGQTRLTNNPS